MRSIDLLISENDVDHNVYHNVYHRTEIDGKASAYVGISSISYSASLRSGANAQTRIQTWNFKSKSKFDRNDDRNRDLHGVHAIGPRESSPEPEPGIVNRSKVEGYKAKLKQRRNWFALGETRSIETKRSRKNARRGIFAPRATPGSVPARIRFRTCIVQYPGQSLSARFASVYHNSC